MKTWQVILFSFLCGVLTAGVILLIALPPRGEAVQLAPLPTTPSLTVYVTGGINQPGVYALPPNSRMKDAIQASGGSSPSADVNAVNLAALLHDGEHLVIPLTGETSPTPAVPGSSITPSTPDSPYSAENPLNINSASQSDLENFLASDPLEPRQLSLILKQTDPIITSKTSKMSLASAQPPLSISKP